MYVANVKKSQALQNVNYMFQHLVLHILFKGCGVALWWSLWSIHVVLDGDIINGDGVHNFWEEYRRVIIFASKFVESRVYYNEILIVLNFDTLLREPHLVALGHNFVACYVAFTLTATSTLSLKRKW